MKNNDQNLIFEAYTKIYCESDNDFRDQMPSSAEVYEPEAEREELSKSITDHSWAEKFIPWGIWHGRKVNFGTVNGREYATWMIRDDDGDRYYEDYYVVYKGDNAKQEISEDEWRHLSSLSNR